VDPATCGTPKACPDFTLCTSGGADTSSGGKGTGEATGAISLCTNSWLTELGSQQNDSDPEGFDCPITVERVHGTERVRDEAGQCEETKRVFGEAAEEGDGDAGWRGGVALLENVFVNQHGMSSMTPTTSTLGHALRRKKRGSLAGSSQRYGRARCASQLYWLGLCLHFNPPLQVRCSKKALTHL